MLKWSMYNEVRRPRPVDVAVLRDDAFGAIETYTIPYDGLYSGAISGNYDIRIEELIAGSWCQTGSVTSFPVYLARSNLTRIKNYSNTAVGIIVFRGIIDGKIRGFRIIRKIYEGTIAGYGTQVLDTDGLFMIVAVCPYGLAIDYYSQSYSAWWTSFTLNSVYSGYVAVGYALGKANRVRLRSASNVSVDAKVYLLGWI